MGEGFAAETPRKRSIAVADGWQWPEARLEVCDPALAWFWTGVWDLYHRGMILKEKHRRC